MTLTDVSTGPTTSTGTAPAPQHRAFPRRPGQHRDARSRRARRAGLLAVLAVVAVLHGWNLAGWPLLNNDDEGTYYAQAWAVLNTGELAHYTYWYDHPPLGWLQLALFVEPLQWVAGSLPAVVSGRMVMVLYTVISAALLYRLARNLGMRPWLALATPLLWALSPLVAFEGRQVFLDNLALPWLIASLVLASNRGRRLPLHVASGLCFAAAVLTKETAVLAAPAVLLLLWQRAYRPTRVFSVVGWVTGAVLAGLVYPLYALLKNELLPGAEHVSLLGALSWQLSSRPGSGFVLTPGSEANGVLSSWLDQDQVLVVGGLGAALVCLALPRLRAVAVLVLVFFAFMLRPSGYLPQMMVITVLPFAALLLAGSVDAVLDATKKLPSRLGAPSRALVAVAAAVALAQATTSWPGQWHTLLRADENRSYVEAMAYVTANLPRDSVVVTDDITWNDLVRSGWAADGFTGAVWYYKLDRDVEAEQALPGGWRDVDYLLIGRPMAVLLGGTVTAETDPQVTAAYANSTVVRQWGSPADRVELRAVTSSAGAP